MNIYESEIKDGISSLIETNNSVAVMAEIGLTNEENSLLLDSSDVIKTALASMGISDYKQDDLYYLNSVLVSVGWNGNDDVFSKAELWPARKTPINKQLNYMHDETDIIGHITNAIVVDHDGNHVDDNLSVDDVPDKLDIITSAVMYKAWANLETRQRIRELIDEIDEGKWCVSMECMFTDFDYAIISPNGQHSVLKRNEDSAFLTKHLRAYGGTGVFEDHKLGRLLKRFYFSGMALASRPANPRSIIFGKDVDPFKSQALTFVNFLTATEKNMADTNTTQADQLQVQLDAAKAELETVKTQLTAEKESAITEAVTPLQAEIDTKTQTIAELTAKVAELETSVAALTEENSNLKSQVSAAAKSLQTLERKSLLAQAGASQEQADNLIIKFADASDDMFKSVVALIQPATTHPKPETEVVETEADAEQEEEADDSNIEEAEATQASLNDTTTVTTETEGEQAFASVVDWIQNSVLTTTRKLNK